jgi:ribose transport system ATP-binding protein
MDSPLSTHTHRPIATARSEVALGVYGASKAFAGTRALDSVSLEVREGEIHALVGANGSGKSTLIKILAGVISVDHLHELVINGAAVDPVLSPQRSHDHGLRFVHQDTGLFDDLSVAENLALGARYATSVAGLVSRRRLNRWAETLIDRFGIDASSKTVTGRLRPSTKTMIAIARAFADERDLGRKILVLDEATAALPEHECESLFEVIRRVSQLRHSVLFVSHRLDEVRLLADRVTVFRDGRSVATESALGLTEQALVAKILGRDLTRAFPEQNQSSVVGEVMLEADNVMVGPLREISFRLHQGEILGVAGLLASGRTTLLRALFCDIPIDAGQIRLLGRPLKANGPADTMAAGIAYVPEDRHKDAAYLDLSVASNLSAATVREHHNGFWFSRGLERSANNRLLARYLIKTSGLDAVMSSLSGGNQQKVILARWMRRAPRVMLLDEPTQGVDVGARAEIYALVRDAVAAGAAALVVASDFEELAHVCDRVLVLRRGHLIADVPANQLDADLLTELSHGATREAETLV